MITDRDLMNQSIARSKKSLEQCKKRLNALKTLYQIPNHVIESLFWAWEDTIYWTKNLEFMQSRLAELQQEGQKDVQQS